MYYKIEKDFSRESYFFDCFMQVKVKVEDNKV